MITTGGPCTDGSIDGMITVNASSTISLSSSVQSAAQTICIGDGIEHITYAIDGGSTGASVTGLPAGVTGNFASDDHEGTFTISGTPTSIGTYNYTITTRGPCNNPSPSGTITVGGVSTISLSSPALSDRRRFVSIIISIPSATPSAEAQPALPSLQVIYRQGLPACLAPAYLR